MTTHPEVLRVPKPRGLFASVRLDGVISGLPLCRLPCRPWAAQQTLSEQACVSSQSPKSERPRDRLRLRQKGQRVGRGDAVSKCRPLLTSVILFPVVDMLQRSCYTDSDRSHRTCLSWLHRLPPSEACSLVIASSSPPFDLDPDQDRDLKRATRLPWLRINTAQIRAH